jgi:hypothetical protein
MHENIKDLKHREHLYKDCFLINKVFSKLSSFHIRLNLFDIRLKF